VEHKEPRRKHKRYKVRWKAAVVFDRATGRPVMQTETHDLSLGGGAIRTEYGDLTGSVVTLLLALPPRHDNEPPRMLKIQAQAVSSVPTPGKPRYRHGLSFIRTPSDELEGLEELLNAAAAGAEGENPAAPPAADEAPAVGRLAALKQAAQAKLAEEAAKPKIDPQKQREQRVSDALQRTYWYLKDMIQQLDVLKPDYPSKGYALPGVPAFGDFAWDVGQVNLRTHETSPTTKIFTRVWMDFRLSRGKPMVKVVRESPANEKMKRMLKDYGINFSSSDTRNESGAILKTSFLFPCEVIGKLELEGNFETGKLLLKTRNVERFGMMEYVITPQAVTQESLEELTGFILGETHKLGPLILKGA
jgi:hypothetical protein